MATTSEIDAALDSISQAIRTERQALKVSKARVGTSVNNLASLTTVHSGVIATINGYGTSDVYETYQKARFAKLTSEFQDLKDDAALAVTDLGNRTEF